MTTCNVPSCDRPAAYACGLCSAHYQRLKRTGDVMVDIPIRAKQRGCNLKADGTRKHCSVSDCNRPARASGYCHAHSKRIRDKGWAIGPKPLRKGRTRNEEPANVIPPTD